MIIEQLDSLGDIKDFTVEMLPPEIFKQYQMNREEEKEDIVFTVMNYFSEDSLIISTFQSVEEKQRRFHFLTDIEISLEPIFVIKWKTNLGLLLNLTSQ